MTVTRRKFMLTIILALLSMLSMVHPIGAQTEEQVREELLLAYEAVSDAEAAGADVTALVLRLDQAAQLFGRTETQLEEAHSIILDVTAGATQVHVEGTQRMTNRLILTGVALIVIGALSLVVWLRGSRVIWRIWLGMHKGWKVERT